ncbi:hypothetical protein ACFYNO_03260 [Kitasatospora sp. NPDC006697]|uniref:hypothetical protein n=1 Tax=Kitasatospora sp. NPDC006697 TaxID=3364020 RepID=UPI0036C5387E
MDPFGELTGDHFRVPPSGFLALPGDVLPPAAIREFDPGAIPPELRTTAGDIVFVSAVDREAVKRFCADHGIPLRTRPDVWAALLEPYLDTEFSEQEQELTDALLRRAGLDGAAVQEIRDRVGSMVWQYNLVVWDWVHLGLADLFEAATSSWVPEELRVAEVDQADFYRWAVRIAGRADHPGT